MKSVIKKPVVLQGNHLLNCLFIETFFLALWLCKEAKHTRSVRSWNLPLVKAHKEEINKPIMKTDFQQRWVQCRELQCFKGQRMTEGLQ